jgi:hypothetical protein
VIFGSAAVMGLLVGLVYLDVRGKGPAQTQYQLSFVFMVWNVQVNLAEKITEDDNSLSREILSPTSNP